MSSATSSRLNSSTSFDLTDVEIGLLSFVNILFSIVGSLGNIFVCLGFVIFPSLRNTMNVFIISLALSDLLVCLVAQPMFVASLLKNYQQEHVNNVFEGIRKGLTWISLLASAGNLLGVTVDRYVAITYPLRYGDNHGVKPHACFFVSIVWAVAICLGISTGFYKKMKLVGQIYVFLVVICFILPLYFRVLYIAKKHKRCILATMTYAISLGSSPNSHENPQQTLRQRRCSQYNALKTVGVISGLFVLGWFPLLILPFVYRSNLNDREFMLSLFQWVNTLALCSSATNPIVYSWTDRRFRESVRIVYKRWVARRLF